MIWLTLHVVGYISSGFVAAGLAGEWWRGHGKRKHRGCLERIARLEIEVGVGLDWGREFFETRKPRGSAHAGKLCWMCHKTYDDPSSLYFNDFQRVAKAPRDRLLRQHLCASCEAKTHRELAEL